MHTEINWKGICFVLHLVVENLKNFQSFVWISELAAEFLLASEEGDEYYNFGIVLAFVEEGEER